MLRDDIENYKPKPEDLDYPPCNRQPGLVNAKTNGPATSGRKGSVSGIKSPVPKGPVTVDETDSSMARYGFEAESTYRGWYPTLRKAIWLLSRIYRLVNVRTLAKVLSLC